MGSILYTLYGHEGATTSAAWSPLGDYFVTGGADSVVLCWQSNMNMVRQEDLSEMQAKIETDVFVTSKEKVDKLPENRGTKIIKNNKENRSKLANRKVSQEN
jgi:WD40 repeat protein